MSLTETQKNFEPQYSDDNLFKTFCIRFNNQEDFDIALEMNNLADDIGYSDMILKYSNEFFRDRFAGFLRTHGFDGFEVL